MITQIEADSLIVMGKSFVNPRTISISPGIDQSHELIGDDKRERFLLDLWRGTIRLSKLKYQTRARKIIVLVRLDIDGSPHTNPDGTKIDGTHIHLYREGYEDKWAFPLNPSEFKDPGNFRQAFDDFCRYGNIKEPPPFQEILL